MRSFSGDTSRTRRTKTDQEKSVGEQFKNLYHFLFVVVRRSGPSKNFLLMYSISPCRAQSPPNRLGSGGCTVRTD